MMIAERGRHHALVPGSIMFGKPLVLLTIACAIAVHALRLDAQQVVASPDSASCWSATESPLILGADARCFGGWVDSLRSPAARHVSRARLALRAVGGRTAVDALLAHHERSPGVESKIAVIAAMATTGSATDVEFLTAQLRGPFTGNSDIWPATQSAAITLRLLRATAAREALAAALAQYGSTGFAGRAVARALADLDRPPCADTVTGTLESELVRIVMECGPEFMRPAGHYRDAATGGTWQFSNERWRLDPSAQLDSAAPLRLSHRVWLAPDRRQAIVLASMWCGYTCGEAWIFRLQLTGDVWRVVVGDMASVS